ncbi:MAG: glycosyltransferase family 9 protein [Gammaproteobacteria bacterium]|nr:glycosyltransferase family 9 protein [Gammaproteobacteria bacterium]
MSVIPPSPARSVCLLRLSALGDVTHMLPVVRTLQQAWPDCRLTWIIGKTEYQLVEGMENIEFIIFDKSQGLKAYWQLRRQLGGRRFDILLHMRAALRASLISLLIKAPLKVGFDKARAADFQWLFSNRKIAPLARQHVLDGFFGFLTAIGIDARLMHWTPPIPPDAVAFARQAIDPARPCLVINPCSSARRNNYRNWHAERYAEVADYAAEKHGLQVVLTGGGSTAERDMADRIAQRARQPLIDLVGRTSIKQLLAVLARARLIIAPDTGPLHMGTAVGTPVIGLFATSNPARTGPYNDLDAVVNAYPQAISAEFGKTPDQVKWGQRVRNPEAMDLLTVEAVTRQLDKSLAALSSTH